MTRLTSQERAAGDEKMEVKEWTLLCEKRCVLKEEVYLEPHERPDKEGVYLGTSRGP